MSHRLPYVNQSVPIPLTPTWVEKFSTLATQTAATSACEKRKVGAVIVGAKGYAIGTNYEVNGEPCECDQGKTKDSVVHAEVAALERFYRETSAVGGVDYDSPVFAFVTHPPCGNCYNALLDAGLLKENIVIVEQFLKFDTDKLRYDLVPPGSLEALASVLTYGAKKYKPNNWKNGDKDRYIAALYRHLEAWRKGESHDEESGYHHLAHALTNTAFLLELDEAPLIRPDLER